MYHEAAALAATILMEQPLEELMTLFNKANLRGREKVSFGGKDYAPLYTEERHPCQPVRDHCRRTTPAQDHCQSGRGCKETR